MPSGAEAIATQVRHVIGAEASDAAAAEASDVIAANAGHVVSTEAADVTTKATHVAAAKASHAATMPSASTAARFCTGGNKAAGKYRACQNHHHSSSHDILHLRWADIPPQGPDRRWRVSPEESQRRDRLEMGMLLCHPH
jgi:hypothetical protein